MLKSFILASSFYLTLLFTNNYCLGQKPTVKLNKKLPVGKWICAQDSLYSIIIKKKYIISRYSDITSDTGSYFLSYQCCDSSYQTSEVNTLFLIWDDNCYQVDGYTKKYIELLHTGSGKFITFHKIK